jgi:hypothetical protein
MSPGPSADAGVRLIMEDTGAGGKTPADSDVRMERYQPPKTPADSDVRMERYQPPKTPADSDVRMERYQAPKTPADSDVRAEEYHPPGRMPSQRAEHPTEEIDLDAELRRAEEMAKKPKPKTGFRPKTPSSSTDFELAPPTGKKKDDATIEFPVGGDDQVELGELPPRDVTSSGADSGINLGSPADSGVNLEKAGDGDQVEFELSLDDLPSTPKPAQPAVQEDSSSEFELSLDVEGTPPPAKTTAKQKEEEEDSSNEFELSLDVEGTPPPAKTAARRDQREEESSSEFELTLDEKGASGEGKADIEADKDIFETDFDVPLAQSASIDAPDVEESDTALESSDFDLSLVDESGSQVVALDEDEIADESSETIAARSAVLDGEAAEEVDELLEDDLGGMEVPDEEGLEAPVRAPGVAARAAPTDWGVLPAVLLIPTLLVMLVITGMSFELLHSMWGYKQPSKPAGMLVKWVAERTGEKVND